MTTGASRPHEVLGVERDASTHEIRSAYRRLARQLHPDLPDGSAERFMEVAAAYRSLTRPEPEAPAGPRPAPPPAPDLSGVAATVDDLDERWRDVVAGFASESAPGRDRLEDPDEGEGRRRWGRWWR